MMQVVLFYDQSCYRWEGGWRRVDRRSLDGDDVLWVYYKEKPLWVREGVSLGFVRRYLREVWGIESRSVNECLRYYLGGQDKVLEVGNRFIDQVTCEVINLMQDGIEIDKKVVCRYLSILRELLRNGKLKEEEARKVRFYWNYLTEFIGGRVRPQYDYLGSETYRVIASKPNIQQVPRNVLCGRCGKVLERGESCGCGGREDERVDVFKIFKGDLVEIDVRHADLYVLGHLAEDEGFLEVLSVGDFYEWVREELGLKTRTEAKVEVFKFLYGKGGRCERVFKERFSGICRWFEEVERRDLLITPFGKVKRFVESKDSVNRKRNFLVQALTSDLSLVIALCLERLNKVKLKWFWHDGVVLEGRVKEIRLPTVEDINSFLRELGVGFRLSGEVRFKICELKK